MILNSQTRVRSRTFDNETLALAVSELGAFLRQSPGCQIAEDGEIEITFVLKGGEGYSVHVDGNRLCFVGATPVAILYAVYTLAEERLGFCFFEPGRDRCVRKDEVVLDTGTVVAERVPLMKRRGLVQEYPFDASNYRLADWMARNRLNYLLTWMEFYDGFPDDLKRYCRARGIEIESGHHSFDYYLPAREYYATHPEYYALINGKRVAPEADDAAIMHSKQLCVTNPAVRAKLADRMIEYARNHPELRTVTIIPNDGFGWCECPTCARFYDKNRRGELFSVSEHVYQAQEIYHDLVRDVAARVHKVLPDINVSFAAYINYIEPAAGMELPPGLTVHVAPYWRCVNHAIHDPACFINRGYMKALRRWGSVTRGGQFNVYEYYMGVNFYLSLPLIHHEVIFSEIRALRDAGAEGILTQFHLPHWTAYGLNYAMMARAAYGEDASVVATYMEKLFGKDAREAQEFYSALRNLVLSAGPCHIPIPRPLFKRTRREQYEAVHRQALNLWGKRPDDRLRRNLIVWMDYLIRFKELFDRYQSGEDVREDIRAFERWAEAHQEHDVCVVERLRLFLDRWIEQIGRGRPWYHFNIPWEDDYVRRYDEILNTTA